jgi:hypothetical protein
MFGGEERFQLDLCLAGQTVTTPHELNVQSIRLALASRSGGLCKQSATRSLVHVCEIDALRQTMYHLPAHARGEAVPPRSEILSSANQARRMARYGALA